MPESNPEKDSLSTVKKYEKRPNNFQPNLLTEAKQHFSELEKKIVVLIINQLGDISMRNEYKEKQNITFQLPYSEITQTNNHKKLELAAEALTEKSYYNRKNEWLDKIKPFPRVRSYMENGRKYIEVTMFADVVPLFIGLGQRYTKYNLDTMLSLNSVYTQRIYEIVMMYKNRNQNSFVYAVEELIYMLNCPATYTYKELNRWALTPAQQEIELKTGIMLNFFPHKKEGKKIIELKFEILTKEVIASMQVERDRQLVNGMSLAEAIILAHKLFRQYKFTSRQKEVISTEPDILSSFLKLHSEIENGVRDVKNPTAYIIASLGLIQETSDALKPRKKGLSKAKKRVSPANEPDTLASFLNSLPLFPDLEDKNS